jgi:hypothetical protein
MLKERIVSRAMEFQTHIEFSKFSGVCNCVVELTEDKEPLVFFQPQSDDIGTAASLRLHMGAAFVLKTSNSRTQKHCVGIDTTDSEQSLRVKVQPLKTKLKTYLIPVISHPFFCWWLAHRTLNVRCCF